MKAFNVHSCQHKAAQGIFGERPSYLFIKAVFVQQSCQLVSACEILQLLPVYDLIIYRLQ